MEEDIAVPNTLLDLNELQCHPGPNLATHGNGKRVRLALGLGAMRTTMATIATPHLCKSDGTLLGLHVATASHSLG